jgi:hypothetical protein
MKDGSLRELAEQVRRGSVVESVQLDFEDCESKSQVVGVNNSHKPL